jgi:hypothetical protein
VSEQEDGKLQTIHGAIEAALVEDEVLVEGSMLTGWLVIYETIQLTGDKRASAGHLYGPRPYTTWQALGLVEWARRFGLTPDEDEDEDER